MKSAMLYEASYFYWWHLQNIWFISLMVKACDGIPDQSYWPRWKPPCGGPERFASVKRIMTAEIEDHLVRLFQLCRSISSRSILCKSRVNHVNDPLDGRHERSKRLHTHAAKPQTYDCTVSYFQSSPDKSFCALSFRLWKVWVVDNHLYHALFVLSRVERQPENQAV
jgi:hypothetical protein